MKMTLRICPRTAQKVRSLAPEGRDKGWKMNESHTKRLFNFIKTEEAQGKDVDIIEHAFQADGY